MTLLELLKTNKKEFYKKNWAQGNYIKFDKQYKAHYWDNEKFSWTDNYIISIEDLMSNDWLVKE